MRLADNKDCTHLLTKCQHDSLTAKPRHPCSVLLCSADFSHGNHVLCTGQSRAEQMLSSVHLTWRLALLWHLAGEMRWSSSMTCPECGLQRHMAARSARILLLLLLPCCSINSRRRTASAGLWASRLCPGVGWCEALTHGPFYRMKTRYVAPYKQT